MLTASTSLSRHAGTRAAHWLSHVDYDLAQKTGPALGPQAGEKKLTEVIRSGGFAQVQRATQTPLNMVLEAT